MRLSCTAWRVLFLGSLLVSGNAQAERYALIAANNTGWGSEAPLQFAHKDAARLAAILKEMGGFQSGNIVLLPDATPQRIEAGLATISKKIQASAGEDLLLFYYSGHADDTALHPGPSKLPYTRLKALIQSVPGAVRIALLDSCKSGTLTKIKGARLGPTFDVDAEKLDRVTGDVFITAASSSENAQESRTLQGSYFTNHLTSGLRGAADSNKDGRVTLSELYSYSFRMTVGSTSGTRGGTQHPAHRFDLRGRGEVVISYPGRIHSCLVVAKTQRPEQFLVIDGARDRVVAEIASDTTRAVRIGVPIGQYRVRQRRPTGVFEQRLSLLAHECRQIQPTRMRKILLPETLSKGQLLQETWSVYAGYAASLANIGEPNLTLHNAVISLRIPIHPNWALRPSFVYGRRDFDGLLLDVETQLWALDVALTWDLATPYGLWASGPFVGYQLFHQKLEPLEDRFISGIRLGGLTRWSIPLPLWRFALYSEFRLGYAVHGLGDQVKHRLLLDLGGGVQVWW